jgi:hypothetical protein
MCCLNEVCKVLPACRKASDERWEQRLADMRQHLQVEKETKDALQARVNPPHPRPGPATFTRQMGNVRGEGGGGEKLQGKSIVKDYMTRFPA